MCQNSFLERSEQIERCVEHGMPEKIVKSVMYTLKKRAAKNAENENENQNEIEVKSNVKHQEQSSTKTIKLATLVPQTLANELFSETLKISQITDSPMIESKQPEPVKSATPIPINREVLIQKPNNFSIPKMCGRFRQQQQQMSPQTSSQNAMETIVKKHKLLNAMNENAKQKYSDVLSVGTAYTKIFCEYLTREANQFMQSKFYRLLTQTTQPAHFIAICILSAVLLTIWPDLVDSKNSIKTGTGHNEALPKGKHNTWAAIAYLGAFATHFGSQIWMTFVSGLSLYFSLPRHTFGQCQQILFPKYFAFNAMLSIILLILFVKCFISTWTLAITVQFITLVLNPIIELTVRLYVAPPMLRLMHEKYKIEYAVGSGQEVGNIMQGDLTQCPHYLRIHKAFRRLHMIVAIGNMTILLSTCVQLCFLASKIQIDIS